MSERTWGSGLKAVAVSAVILVGGSGAALALGSGADPGVQPRKAISTEDGSAGEMSYRTANFLIPAANSASGHVRCPRRTHATGGGYRIESGDGSIVVVTTGGWDSADAGLVPDDGWEVTVSNSNPLSGTSASVSVICHK